MSARVDYNTLDKSGGSSNVKMGSRGLISFLITFLDSGLMSFLDSSEDIELLFEFLRWVKGLGILDNWFCNLDNGLKLLFFCQIRRLEFELLFHHY